MKKEIIILSILALVIGSLIFAEFAERTEKPKELTEEQFAAQEAIKEIINGASKSEEEVLSGANNEFTQKEEEHYEE